MTSSTSPAGSGLLVDALRDARDLSLLDPPKLELSELNSPQS